MLCLQNKTKITFQTPPASSTTYTIDFNIADFGDNPSPYLNMEFYSDVYNKSISHVYNSSLAISNVTTTTSSVDEIKTISHVSIKKSGGDACYISQISIKNDNTNEGIGFTNPYNVNEIFPFPRLTGSAKGWFDSDVINGYFNDNLFQEHVTIYPFGLPGAGGRWGWMNRSNKTVVTAVTTITSGGVFTPGGTNTLNVQLATDPGENVVLDFYSYIKTSFLLDNEIIDTFSPSQITLNSSNWNTGINVTLTAVSTSSINGFVFIGSETHFIKHNMFAVFIS